jgi:hypothetical protein
MKPLAAVILGAVILCIALAYFHGHSNTWRLENCTATPPAEGAAYGDQHLVLRGPSIITTTVQWGGACNLPLGTEFFRDNQYVCPESERANLKRKPGLEHALCYEIESEKRR